MATHDYVIANATGSAVRSDLNNALAAIVSNNSSASEPSTTYAYQWWADTNATLLKIRNAANNAWITVGDYSLTNFGSALLAGATFTGDVVLNTTTALQLPVGTVAQRPGSPTNGDIRYNSDAAGFEGYAGGAWGSLGGASFDEVFYENKLIVSSNTTLTASRGFHAVGPITVNTGVSLTIPADTRLVIS